MSFAFPVFQNYTYSLIDQAENAVNLWRKLGVKRAHLVSHDMGDSVLTEVLTLRDKTMLDGKLSNDFFKVFSCHLFYGILNNKYYTTQNDEAQLKYNY